MQNVKDLRRILRRNLSTSLTPNEVGTVQIQRAPTVSLFDSLGKTKIGVRDK